MFSFRDFWRRHRRKVYVSLGVVGSGYALYRLYDAHRTRLAELEEELVRSRDNDERIKAQLQDHYENIQRISDTTTLPHSVNLLSRRVSEELDISAVKDRLMQAKGQPNALTASEKDELWDRLKILSFTRMVLSLWSMTLISLYVKVLVNILGRHLYVDMARGLQGSQLIDEADLIEVEDEQKFLARSDVLANSALPTLIDDVQAAVTESVKNTHLGYVFNTKTLHDTLLQILSFMSAGNPHPWMKYLMPGDPNLHKQIAPLSDVISFDGSKFDQLMAEAQAVLSRDEFGNIVEVSLNTLVEALVKEVDDRCSGALSQGVPLAKLLPRLAQTSSLLLDRPTSDKFVGIIRNIPEVELFFTLLYTSSLPP